MREVVLIEVLFDGSNNSVNDSYFGKQKSAMTNWKEVYYES